MATFWGSYNDHFSTCFCRFWGPDFSGSRRNFWARGGPKMTILAIFGHFWGGPGPRQNPEISGNFPPGFTAVWGGKICRYPLFKILAALERNRKSRKFRFLRESALFSLFWAILGPIFGHFWPFLPILGISGDLGPGPPRAGKNKNPV